jgi:hypothetical protein
MITSVIENKNTSKSEIETDALYSMTMQNGQTTTVTGQCLLHNYLNDQSGGIVESYERLAGQWFDIVYQNKKVFCVYAENEPEALVQRKEDLDNLGYTENALLSALAA